MRHCPFGVLLVGLEFERRASEIRRLLNVPRKFRSTIWQREMAELLKRAEEVLSASEHLGFQ